MRLGRAVAACLLVLGPALAAACGTDAFTVASDASDSDAASDAPAETTPGSDAGSDTSVDASVDSPVDAPAPVPGCESRANPVSPCSQSALSCTKSAIWTPPADAGAPLSVFAITTDATHVYWVSQAAYNGNALGVVYRVPKSGGTTEVLAKDQPGPYSLAVDNVWVYWMTTGLGIGPKTILRLPKGTACKAGTCPVPQPIFSGDLGAEPTIHMLAEQDLYVVSASTHFRHFFDPLLPGWRSGTPRANGDRPSAAADRHGIFVGASSRRQVDRVSQDGTSVQKAFDVSVGDAGPFPGATRMAKDCSSVLVMRDSITDLLRFPTDGGAPVTVVPAPRNGVYALAIDETFAYLGVANSGGVFRTVKKGGGPVSLVHAGNVWAITTDDNAVYWGDHETGVVFRLDK